MDYNGIKNFPSLLHQDLLSDTLGSTDKQNRIIKDIISDPHLVCKAK